MQQDKKVSVILPIYNVENELNRCIDSVVNQSYKNLEIILVDDGSPDNCGEICEERAKLDNRIKVIHKKNEGLGLARNSGLKIVTGEYVVFIDSDDYIKNNYIELMINAMIKYNSDLVVGGFIRKFVNGQEIKKNVTNELQIIEKKDIVESILLPVIGADPSNKEDVEREMCVWRNMYKMSIIKKLDLVFVSERDYISEDIFFNMKYFMNIEKAVLIPECIYYYIENPKSLTYKYRTDRFEKYCKMLEEQINILNEKDLLGIAQMRLYRTFIMKVKKCLLMISLSNLSYTNKKIEIDRILRNEKLEIILKYYSQNKNINFWQKIVLFLMKHKLKNSIIIFYKLKNKKM